MMTSERVDVVICQGSLRGIVEKNVYNESYVAFRGIPYAKPPIGELRFQDPLPPEPWSGVRDATKFGDKATQINEFTHKIDGSEDCLYLNVYTTTVEPKVKRAVMVWIHGGGFKFGSANHDLFGPDYIVRKDVVLVTLNYRLGALGFLNLDHEIAAGNQGLKDTLMALRWVQENISNFGGDPGNVTIFGQSAGGAIVHYLATSPLANGLFHKAISQSGTGANTWAFNDSQKAWSFLLAEKLGKRTSDPKIAGEFLKTVDARKIVEATRILLREIEKNVFFEFAPSLDNRSPNPFFLEHPAVTFSRGVKVPYLLGFTTCESSIFMQNITSTILQEVDSKFEKIIHPKILSMLKQKSIAIEDLRSLYFGNRPVSKETRMNFANFYGDMHIYCSIYETANIQMQLNHRSTYMYQFSYESEISLFKKLLNISFPGTTHCDDLNYLFYAHMATDMGLPLPERDSEDYRMINSITQMWTDFAKTENPTPAVTDLTPIKWMPLKKGNVYKYLNIDKKLRMKTTLKEELRCNWDNIMSDM